MSKQRRIVTFRRFLIFGAVAGLAVYFGASSGAQVVAPNAAAPAPAAAPPVITWGAVNPGVPEPFGASNYTDVLPSAIHTNDGVDDSITGVSQNDFDGSYPFPYCQPEIDCPYKLGVFATRTSDGGLTWESRVRLNPEDQNGTHTTIAVDESDVGCALPGCNVYAAWTDQVSYYDSAAASGPRALHVAWNPDFGSTTASWNLPATQLTSSSGQVGFPAIAAANGKVYVAWTNAISGRIWFAVSSDNGMTWTRKTIGRTTNVGLGPYPYGNSGFEGKPALAVTPNGMGIGVIFIADRDWDLRVLTSTNGGGAWSTKTVARGLEHPNPRAVNTPTAAAVAGRIAYAWTDGEHVFIQEFDMPGGWRARRTVASFPAGPYESVKSTAIALYGANTTGVAYGACFGRGCPNFAGGRLGSDLLYRESRDKGMTFSPPAVVGAKTASFDWNNSLATILFEDADTRFIRWNQEDRSGFNYTMLLREGTS